MVGVPTRLVNIRPENSNMILQVIQSFLTSNLLYSMKKVLFRSFSVAIQSMTIVLISASTCIYMLFSSCDRCKQTPASSSLDWLQSLEQFFFNVSYHILVAILTLMALFLKQSHQT